MYTPASFVEDRVDVLHALMRAHPFAVVVISGPDGPEATHVPVVLHSDEGPHGVLRFHFARANEQWKRMQDSAILAIFHGPEHYISPSWYPSKQEHGKVVPTWNYVAVHVRGRATVFHATDKLLEHLRALVDQNESSFEAPWSIDDAPKQYVEGMSKGIVGVEVSIETIEGKWKLNQNRSLADRQGVIAGLATLHSPAADEMARLMAECVLK